MNNKLHTPKVLLEHIPALLAFLMPLFFLPTTTEFFEFNKLALLLVATSISVLLWAVKMLVDKKVLFTRSALDIPIVLMLIVLVLSAIFSVDKVAAIYGQQNRWYPSLVAMLTTAVFYYTVSTNIKSAKIIKLTLMSLLTGITLSSVVSILSYFGVYIGSAQYFQINTFSTTGSLISTTVMAVLALVVATSSLIQASSLPSKMTLTLVALVNTTVVALIGGSTGWLLLAVGMLISLLIMPFDSIKTSKIQLAILSGFIVALVAVSILPSTRSALFREDFPSELKTPLRESWAVSLNTVRDFPILGSGPGTYAINYTNYKPISINSTDFWNVRFDKPFSEPFNIISAFGLLGAAVFGFLIYRIAKVALRVKNDKDNYGVSNTLSAAMLTMLVVFIFTFATVLNTFVFVLLTALAVAKLAADEKDATAENIIVSLYSIKAIENMSIVGALNPSKKEILQYLLLLPMVSVVVLAFAFTYRVYRAEYYMRKSLEFTQQNNGSLAYNYQTMAINAYPRRSFYHNTYAQTSIAIANSIANSQEELGQNEAEIIQQLIGQAIRSARISTETLNPLDVNGWLIRGDIYRALIGVAADADQWAIRAYTTAVQLEPLNPDLRISLGGVYYLTGDYLSAASQYRTATTLKPDYANAHYNLAQALIQLDSPVDALRALNTTRGLIPTSGEDYNRVTIEIEELTKIVNTRAQEAASNIPTIEDIEQVVSEGQQPTAQQPLTTPEERARNETQRRVELDETVPLETPTQ